MPTEGLNQTAKENPENSCNSSDCDILFRRPPFDESKISNATGLTLGSVTNYSDCPPGLEYLYLAKALYLKPYSGPHVVGHLSTKKRFEILNCEGRRIFMLSSDPPAHKSNLLVILDDDAYNKRKCPLHMTVVNHMEEEVFHYYGTPGKVLKVGCEGSVVWGEVSRHRNTICGFDCSNRNEITFDAFINNMDGKKDRNAKSESDRRFPVDVSAVYSIQGDRVPTFFPSTSTKKLYYGTFDCKIWPLRVEGDAVKEAKTYIGKVSTNLKLEKLGFELPGISFPKDLDVHHKAVLFGTLLLDVIRN